MTTYYNVPDLPGVPPMLRDPSAAARALYTPAASLVLDFSSSGINLANSVTGNSLSQLLSGDDDFGNSSSNQDPDAWGLFDSDSGQKVIDPDTFVGIEYRNSTRISDYPMEEGAFESYNKVNNPFDVVIGMACGGDVARRTAFLETARLLAASLDLYTVVTPEEIFESVNIERYDYKRAERNGVGLVTVNFYLREIRVNTQSEFANTPDTAPTVEEAQAGTTAQTLDVARASQDLAAANVQNPASASPVSQGQTQALPATATQAGPAFNLLPNLPTGYSQDLENGLVYDVAGRVDEELTIRAGSKVLVSP